MLLIINSVSAITATTCSSKLDIKYYIVPSTITHSICVKNENDYPATVTFEPTGNIADIIEFSENPVVLAVNETKFVPFGVTITQEVVYTGNIKSNFYVPQDNFPNLAAISEVTISKGTCEDGDTLSCMVEDCEGTRICNNGSFGDCIKNDPNCGPRWNYTEIKNRVEILENKTLKLENDVSALQALLNSLQSIITTIQDTINSILERLTALEETGPTSTETECDSDADCNADGWVGSLYCSNDNVYQDFRDWFCVNPGTEESYCGYTDTSTLKEDCTDTCVNGECVDIECYSDSDCGTNVFEENLYCIDNDVYQDKRIYICSNPGTAESSCSDSLDPILIQECDDENEICENGECVPIKKVIFRTDVVDGDYRHARGTWVAVDCDNDGNLEGYGGVGISRTGKVRNPIGSTPEDYPYQCFKSNTEVRIRIPSRDVIYSSSATPDNPPEFSSEPTEPYATNGQELYE